MSFAILLLAAVVGRDALTENPRRIWKVALPDTGALSPTVARNGTVYVGGGFRPLANGMNQDGSAITADQLNLYAVSASGKVRWKFHTQTGVDTQPVIGTDGTIYIVEGTDTADNGMTLNSIFGSLDAIKPSGKTLWMLGGGWGGGFSDNPVRGPNGMVYVNDSFDLRAFGPGGRLLWKKPLPRAPYQGLTNLVIGSKRMFGLLGSEVYSISFSGKTKKIADLSDVLQGNLAEDVVAMGDAAFVELPRHFDFHKQKFVSARLYRVSVDGNRKLVYEGDQEVASPGAFGRNLLVKLGRDTLCCLGRTGRIYWSVKLGGSITAPSVQKDGTILVGSSTGEVIALTQSGKAKWRFKTGGPIVAALTVTRSGRVYVTCKNGLLYAIRG